MVRRSTNLIEQVERDALDESIPVAAALRKCIVLGGKSGSEKLRVWATRELQGYHGEDAGQLPDYRIIAAPLVIDGIAGYTKVTHQPISSAALPDVVQDQITESLELRDGVGQLEALAKHDSIRLSPPRASDVVLLMNAADENPYQQVTSLYWSVSPTAVHGVVDQIRTALAQLVAELRANMESGEAVPTAETADQAVNVVVTGKRSKVTVNAAQARDSGTARQQRPNPPTSLASGHARGGSWRSSLGWPGS